MNTNKPTNQIEAIHYYIERMDIDMIDLLLDSNKTYQDFEKYLFISKLQRVFDTFIKAGDTHLIPVAGRCNSCDKTKSGFLYVGNNSHHYMNLIFDTSEDKINDLFECRNFKHKNTQFTLKDRIYIDTSFEIPF